MGLDNVNVDRLMFGWIEEEAFSYEEEWEELKAGKEINDRWMMMNDVYMIRKSSLMRLWNSFGERDLWMYFIANSNCISTGEVRCYIVQVRVKNCGCGGWKRRREVRRLVSG